MNINTFKQFLKKNKVIDTITRIIAYPMFLYQYKKSDQIALKRKLGYQDKRYLWIKNLHNSHKGERCFVIATGPSLLIEDLEKIKNEYSFSMNSIIKAFPKTKWRPDFYMIQDEYVYDKLEQELFEIAEKEDFIISAGGVIPQRYISAEKYKEFPLHYLNHKMFRKKGWGKFKFSDDCYSVIYDGYTVALSVLQMACYMGFKEIYLLGCDCNYNLSKSHFIDYGHHDPKAIFTGDRLIQGHYEFKKFADSKGIKVINCTRGGMLEVYPRMELEVVLKK